jgi:hypothetical protein
MELGGEGASVYAEAKSEYTKQLCQYLIPSIQQYFLDLLDEARQKEPDTKRVLVMFQTLMEGISDWNVDKVQRETGSIVSGTGCDYLEELMTAVFISHTKVLSAIRLTTKQKKLQITIPKLEHFIHRILRECSRILWSNTYLFSTIAPSLERQKNLRLIENCIQEGVLQGIRSMLPVKNILREYLKDDGGDDEEEDAKEEVEEVKEGKEEVEEVKETKEGVKEEVKEELEIKVEEEAKEDVKEEPKSETVIVDSSPISFSGNDTLDETEMFEDIEKGYDDGTDNEEIEIIDAPPEPMDGYEELDKPEPDLKVVAEELDNLQMDFETLD